MLHGNWYNAYSVDNFKILTVKLAYEELLKAKARIENKFADGHFKLSQIFFKFQSGDGAIYTVDFGDRLQDRFNIHTRRGEN